MFSGYYIVIRIFARGNPTGVFEENKKAMDSSIRNMFGVIEPLSAA